MLVLFSFCFYFTVHFHHYIENKRFMYDCNQEEECLYGQFVSEMKQLLITLTHTHRERESDEGQARSSER